MGLAGRGAWQPLLQASNNHFPIRRLPVLKDLYRGHSDIRTRALRALGHQSTKYVISQQYSEVHPKVPQNKSTKKPQTLGVTPSQEPLLGLFTSAFIFVSFFLGCPSPQTFDVVHPSPHPWPSLNQVSPPP